MGLGDPVNQNAGTSRRFRMIISAVVVLLVLVGLLRVVSTYHVFWQTWDEPAHIAAGMEWLDQGAFTYERFHPPLARVMAALGPYAAGLRSSNQNSMWDEGRLILQADGEYERNLRLARIGILPFFVIASVVVAWWGHSLGGVTAAFVSVLLFTTLPPILGHAGVATLDMACAALVVATLLMFDVWIRRPSKANGFLLGFIAGLAILTKFSALAFLAATAVLVGAVHIFGRLDASVLQNTVRTKIGVPARSLAIAILACALTIWAGYGFSVATFDIVDRPHEMIDKVFGNEGLRHDLAYRLAEAIPIPAPEFLHGMRDFFARNDQGQLAFLFGDIQHNGWWYFQPVVLVLKTPLPFVVLCALGIFLATRDVLIKRHDLRLLTPVAAMAGIMLIGMVGNVNNGTRQLLVVYPLAAIVAGYGAFRLMSLRQNRNNYFGAGVVTLLLAWQIMASAYAHPDYLSYFNSLAKGQPEKIVVDSDLDWGQDLKRLAKALERREIERVHIKYNGSLGLELDDFDFPPWEELKPYDEVSGWVAISLYHLQLGTKAPPYDQFVWLKKYEPVEKLGNSIWLYHID